MTTYDDEHCLRRYRVVQQAEPEWFVNSDDCPTTILSGRDEIQEAQTAVRAERLAAGFPVDDLRVGVLGEDHYIGCLIRDAVRFSDGRLGLYNRVMATGGVVVLPVIGDHIALIRIFRHAPRRWFMEAPQGFVAPDGDPLEEAGRELQEEMGATALDLVSLGVVYTSTALTSENLKIFVAKIDSVGLPQRDEGIESIHLIHRNEIDERILDGTICDGPTTTAITRARLRGFL